MQKTPRPIDKTEPVFSTAACLLAVLICSACAGSRYTGDLEEELVESENFFHAPVMITAGNASNFTQDLSPNGKWVLYTSDKTGNQDIWEKEIHGGENRRLTGHSADDLGAVMSPDGNTFAFVSRRQDATGDMINLEATPAEGTSHRLALKDKACTPHILCANEADYRNGVRWYHFDPTKWGIRLLSKVGLVSRLRRTPRSTWQAARKRPLSA